jgi:hypothetical protein
MANQKTRKKEKEKQIIILERLTNFPPYQGGITPHCPPLLRGDRGGLRVPPWQGGTNEENLSLPGRT